MAGDTWSNRSTDRLPIDHNVPHSTVRYRRFENDTISHGVQEVPFLLLALPCYHLADSFTSQNELQNDGVAQHLFSGGTEDFTNLILLLSSHH